MAFVAGGTYKSANIVQYKTEFQKSGRKVYWNALQREVIILSFFGSKEENNKNMHFYIVSRYHYRYIIFLVYVLLG